MKHTLFVTLLVLTTSSCIRTEQAPEPAATPLGIPIGTPITASIGVSGGTLRSDDGRASLLIPAGALASDTALSITPVMNFAHGGIETAYQLGPEGTTFAIPATLSFVIDEGRLVRSDVNGVGIAYQSTDGLWHWSDAVYDASAHTLSVQTQHLSSWSLVEGVQMIPGGALVLENASLPLAVVSCYVEDAATGALAPLGYVCDDSSGLAPLYDVDQWAVNGVAGGDGAHGTIEGDGHTATYHAPATTPTPPTVRVSARVRRDALGGVVYVFSNLAIGAPHPLAGTVTVRQAQSGVDFTVSLDVALTVVDDGIDETNWSATGTARLSPMEFAMGDATCVADMPTQVVAEEYFLKVRKDPILAVRFGSLTGWNFTCTNAMGTMYPWFIGVSGQTGHGLGCIQPDDAPITDVSNIDATYAATCSPIAPAEIHWMLHRTD